MPVHGLFGSQTQIVESAVMNIGRNPVPRRFNHRHGIVETARTCPVSVFKQKIRSIVTDIGRKAYPEYSTTVTKYLKLPIHAYICLKTKISKILLLIECKIHFLKVQ